MKSLSYQGHTHVQIDSKRQVTKSALTDDEMNSRISALTSFLDRLVSVGDGFFHVETVQVNFAGLTVL